MTDTAAIQAIINGSSKPFIPDGSYTIGRLNIPPETEVEASPRALFIAASGLNEPMVDMPGSHSSKWKGGHFTSNSEPGSEFRVFKVVSANDVEISRAHIINGGRFAVHAEGGSGLDLNRLRVDQAGQNAIYVLNAYDAIVSRCRLFNSLAHNLQFEGGSGHIATLNHVGGAYQFNISLFKCAKTQVIANHCKDSRLEAIQAQDCDAWAFLDNVCSWPSGGSLDFGMSAWGEAAENKHCDRGIISRNIIEGSGKAGIALAENVTDTEVTENQIINCNKLNEPDGSASILFYGVAQNGNLVGGNRMTSTFGHTKYGMLGVGGNRLGTNFSTGHTISEAA